MPRDRSRSRERYTDRRRSRSPPPRRDKHDFDRRRSRSRERDRYEQRNPPVEPLRRSRSRSPAPKRRRISRSASRSRSRSRSKERSHHKRKRRSRSRSSSLDSSDSEYRRKRRKEKKEKKARKKEKKEKKKNKLTGATPEWGRYGIITDIDIFNKGPEFHTWLVEERKINPETISKDQSKKEFSRFVEDFNTATLPHEKYYNMAVYESRMSALRSGEFVPPSNDAYDANADLKILAGQHKKHSVEKESYLSKEQLMELRKVQNERIEAGKMKLLGMDIKQSMGVRMEFGDE